MADGGVVALAAVAAVAGRTSRPSPGGPRGRRRADLAAVAGRTVAGLVPMEGVVAEDGSGVPAAAVALVGSEREPTRVDHASGVDPWVRSWIAPEPAAT